MRYLKTAVFAAIGVVLLVLLLREIRFEELGLAIRSIDWRFTLLAFASYIGANLVRAERFSLILERKISRREFLRIVLLQNFFNVILPFRLGELSYIALVEKRGGVGLGENIASLIGARTLDLMSIIILFLVGLLTISPSVASSRLLFLVGLAVAVALLAGLAVVTRQSGRAQSARRWWSDVIVGFSIFRGRRTLLSVVALSLAAWILTFFSGALLLRGVGILLGAGEYLFVYAFPIFISMTPLVVFGGFGSYEGSLVFPLFVLGIDRAVAISSSIVIHLQELGFVFVLAAVGYALIRPGTWGRMSAFYIYRGREKGDV